MKIMTILGTRPEIIRLSIIIKRLDQRFEHILVHTGQNFDKNLSDIFFKQLEIRDPDYFLNVKEATRSKQVAKIIEKVEEVILKEKPDKILILGDTNSGLSSIPASFLKVPIFHMEAGNRCFDLEVPEEKNRVIIDNLSDWNLPYTEISKNHLLKEGFNEEKIIVTGNPIYEVLNAFEGQIDKSDILNILNLESKNFALVTFHRSENVDNIGRLFNVFNQLNSLSNLMKVIVSIHPRTRSKLDSTNFKSNQNLVLLEPLSFFDFVKLEKEAKIILTDSGTVQEEACILRTPCIILRNSTERTETILCGGAELFSPDRKDLLMLTNNLMNINTNWQIPKEYLVKDVSDKIIEIMRDRENV